MKRVLISTYCQWSSFGSILQSLGLQKSIKKYTTEVKTLVFESDYKIPAVKKIKLGINKETVYCFLQLFNKKKLEIGKKRCIDFIDGNICTVKVTKQEKIIQELDEADIYIAGSDQIWHPVLCREDFFLDYAPKAKKRVSYAASMGLLDIPENNKQKFSRLLNNFDVISVREAEMIPILSKYTNKNILQNIDPTFLLTSEEWKAFEHKYDFHSPYILVYAIYWDKSLNKELKELHKRTGVKILSIQSGVRSIYANEVIMDAGPSEFLWLVDNAEAVITSSFHGTAFSIIFNKRFYSVNNPMSPSRITSLLNLLEVKSAPSIDSLLNYSYDYKFANNRIMEERNKSECYLRRIVLDE